MYIIPLYDKKSEFYEYKYKAKYIFSKTINVF